MSSESELREELHSAADIPLSGIDPQLVVRTARARRLPKQIAFSSLSVLAIAGVATLGVVTLPGLHPAQDGASTAGMMVSAPESSLGDSAGGGSQKFSDPKLTAGDLCGTPTLTAPQSSGDSSTEKSSSPRLALALNFPASAPSDGADVTGTVTLTNTGTTRASGTTASIPTITVSREGMTVWHTNGPSIMQITPVELDPGQSQTYDATFTAVECGSEDEPDQFRENLPALGPGTYAISAHLAFVSDSGESGDTVLVSGPTISIDLR